MKSYICQYLNRSSPELKLGCMKITFIGISFTFESSHNHQHCKYGLIKKAANEKLLIQQKSRSFTASQHSDFGGGEKGWTVIEVFISLGQGTNTNLKKPKK